jgi:hypothetical protein
MVCDKYGLGGRHGDPRDLEVGFRRRLPAAVRCYTGDDFNFPRLIAGDDEGHSHALVGIHLWWDPEIWARDGDAVLIDMIERFRTHVV